MANSFKDKAEKKRAAAGSPALMFISQPQEQAQKAEEPAGKKETRGHSTQAKKAAQKASKAMPQIRSAQAPRAAQGAEAKSRRLQLLIQPSLYEEVKARAEAEGTSVNDQISTLLRLALDM